MKKNIPNFRDKEAETTVHKRRWAVAKRDTIIYKGSKMKIRKFVNKVADSLPKMIDTETEEPINHRLNIIDAYCESKLVGIDVYETMVWAIAKDNLDKNGTE